MKALQRLCNLMLALMLLLAASAARAQAVDVEVQGLGSEETENVRKSLSLLRLAEDAQWTNSDILQRHRAADREIREALVPFGYYSPAIESELTQTTVGQWRAVYVVQAGPPVLIRKVRQEITGAGANEAELQSLIRSSGLASGERLLHTEYEKLKESLLQTATNRGYLDAKWTRHQMRVDVRERSADIELVLDTGPRYTFGDLRFEQDVLAPEVFARYVSLQAGEPFDAEQLLKTQFALSDSGYFEQVDVRIEREQAVDGRVPVTVIAKARKRARYSAGIGYGTDTGPRLSLGTELRWTNPQGHRLRGDLRLSAVKSTLASQYLIPMGDIREDYLAFTANVEDTEDLGDGVSRAYILGVRRNQSWRGWERSLYLHLERESYTFSNVTRQTTLLTPGISLKRAEMDDPVFPRQGWSLFIDLHGAERSLLSDNTFLQAHVVAHAVFPLGDTTRLLLRTEAGSSAVDEFSRLPASQRFYAGGDQSVRGYRFQSLGPVDSQGNVVGGEHLLVGSIEADWFFRESWGAAVFFDMGGASNDGDFDFARGVGLGLRWRSPIGLLRVDLAHPLDASTPDVRLHLSVGTDL